MDCLAGFLLAAFAISALPRLYHSYDPHHRGFPQPSPGALTVAVTTLLAVGVAVAVRRPFPQAACVAVLAAWLALLGAAGRYSLATPAGTAMIVASAMVIYQVAAGQPRRTALAVLGLSLAAPLPALPWGSPELQEGIPIAIIAGLTAWTIGHLVGRTARTPPSYVNIRPPCSTVTWPRNGYALSRPGMVGGCSSWKPAVVTATQGARSSVMSARYCPVSTNTTSSASWTAWSANRSK